MCPVLSASSKRNIIRDDVQNLVIRRDAQIGLATPAGTLYLLLENSTDKKPYQLAKQTPSQKVRIVGRTFTRGGFHTLTVDRLEIVGQEAAGCSERAPDPALGAPGYCGEN